jgi:phosphopantetheine--protein transferase-like protein
VSLLTNPKGKVIRREHFRAHVLFGEAQAQSQVAPHVVEMPRDPRIGAADIYQRYFHGPSFQVLDHVLTLGEDGVDARPVATATKWFPETEHQDFHTQPYLREAGFQAAGIWEMAELGRMALPSGIDEIWLGQAPAPGTRLVVQARRRGTEEHGSVFDVWVRDEDGVIYDVMRGYRTAKLRDLEAGDRFEPAHAKDAAPTWLTLDIAALKPELGELAAPALQRYLSAVEQIRFRELKTDKRRIEWLAGRIAAKRLIRELKFCHEGAIVPYNAIEILPDELGAPRVRVVGEQGPWPLISISHSAGVAAAMLSAQPHLVPGIDVEQIETRDASFGATYFTDAERAAAKAAPDADTTLTAIWAVKEGILKALGIGARVDLREIKVSHERGNTWRVVLEGEARARAVALGAGEANVQVDISEGRVVARVLLPVTQQRQGDAVHELNAEANAEANV